MNTFLKLAVALTAVAFTAGTALAEGEGNYAYFLGSFLDTDDTFDQDDGWGLELGLGTDLSERWNIEGYVQRTLADGSPKISTSAIGTNLQLVFNRASRFQPYVFAGVAYQQTNTTTLDDDSGVAPAAGVGFRSYFGDSQVALRGEFRYRQYDLNSFDLDDKLFSLGLQFSFGEHTPPPVIPVRAADSDGDGVGDDLDRCPNTPSGVSVDARGCALDSDGDGVADHMDECPDTTRGAAVDAKGCEMDSDDDGVVDRLDQCPNSAPGVQVDISGCEIKEEIRLPGVNFESNSDRLLPGAESVLNNAAATLNKNPEIKVEVAGHTDSDGAAEYNESLSARRAATVRDYLINKGVAEDRMTTRGYGESQPVADNSTSIGKASNRRVVLRITER